MASDSWRMILVAALATNAVLGFAYRVFRLTRGGPMADVVGQGILGLLLGALAAASAAGQGWPRWAALGYALVFGLAVMPVWTLAVLIPLSPGAVDYAFTLAYWLTLAVIAVAAVAV